MNPLIAALLLVPALAGVVQARTLGTPSTFIMQLGHLPDKHSRPRGRWYLKLRVKMRCPERYKAEATVSPVRAWTGLPQYSNVNVSERSSKLTFQGKMFREPRW